VNDPLAKSQSGTGCSSLAQPVPKRSRRDRCAKPLALAAAQWQGRGLTKRKKDPTGAGAIIAFLILGGAITGGLMGQPSIGLLSGLALGILIALLLWLRERGK